MHRSLSAACIASAVACAHRPPEVLPVSGMHHAIPELQLADIDGGGDVDAARSKLDALAADCPSLADGLLLLDCSEAPCHAHVWANAGHTWSDVTCGAEDGGTRLVDLSFSLDEERMATWHVYALAPAGAIDLDAQRARAATAGHAERLAQVWVDAR